MEPMHKGIFISVEGGEGAGKSTMVQGVAAALRRRVAELVLVREPGSTPLGERLRELLLTSDYKIAPTAELLLFLAARAQLLDEVIRPALARGAVVLCDRFNASTIAYQGGGRGLGVAFVRRLCLEVCGATLPDLSLLLDLDPGEGLRRRRGSGAAMDRLEGEQVSFHSAVRAAFLEQAAADERLVVLDAAMPPQQVVEAALAALERVGL